MVTKDKKQNPLVSKGGSEKKGLAAKFMKKKEKSSRQYSFHDHPHLMALKPKEKYVFHSDYFEIDNGFATILSFFHDDGAMINLPAFWGINRIPALKDNKVTAIVLEQTRRMTDGWLRNNQSRAENVTNMNMGEQERGKSTYTQKEKISTQKEDLHVIAQELNSGASYLHTHNRLFVKADTLEKLDTAVEDIERWYIDRFGSLRAEAYPGEQRRELTDLFKRNAVKRGKGTYYTSKEYAGSYHLVTHGLADETGEYIGYMVGDVNNSAVLFDVDKYKHHIMIANDNINEKLGRAYVSDMWGSKISQAALVNNHKVIHIILNGAKLDKLGPKFKNLTSTIDMNTGDVNMFEMFGDAGDELSIFPQQMQKLILMAEQAYETTETDRSIIRGSLEEVVTKYYIDSRMWYANAQENRDRLRIVGIPHEEVPKLELFVSYLSTEYKKELSRSARDERKLNALNVLQLVFKNLLSNNGDLFNTVTSNKIDSVVDGRRVVYDFSKLMMRGKGIAMAQLVNIVGFAVGNLGLDDTVIIHGAELIDKGIKDYLETQFNFLYERGGRICFLYNKIELALADKKFNRFDTADYVVFGSMTNNLIQDYQKHLGQKIPEDLTKWISNKGTSLNYIRRDFDNIVFELDLSLGIGLGRKGRR